MSEQAIKMLAAVFLITVLSGCTNKADAERALSDAGFTDIQAGGFGWLSCSEDDFFRTKFTATNSNGKVVHGVVCSGLLFKSATIRF